MYGNPFLDKYRTGMTVDGRDTGIENMKTVWLESIREHGLTLGQLKRGLAGCAALKFAPSWPEFLAVCRPPPDPVALYQEALAGFEARARGDIGSWSHPAVYWAATGLRAELLGQSWGLVKERWAAALSRQFARASWDAIPVPLVALPAPGGGALENEIAAKLLRQLCDGMLPKSLTQQSGPQMQWAEKLQRRALAGAPLTITQRQMLLAVLGPPEPPP